MLEPILEVAGELARIGKQRNRLIGFRDRQERGHCRISATCAASFRYLVMIYQEAQQVVVDSYCCMIIDHNLAVSIVASAPVIGTWAKKLRTRADVARQRQRSHVSADTSRRHSAGGERSLPCFAGVVVSSSSSTVLASLAIENEGLGSDSRSGFRIYESTFGRLEATQGGIGGDGKMARRSRMSRMSRMVIDGGYVWAGRKRQLVKASLFRQSPSSVAVAVVAVDFVARLFRSTRCECSTGIPGLPKPYS